jgi:class 3 adenylate cyclase/tetratricopeptide (TPR) repeat protein
LICPSCGRENREGAAFCDACGTSLAPGCPKCGAQLRVDSKFCDSCGTPVTADTEADLRPRTPAHLAKKILEGRSRIQGERRTVTVLFADAKGFTPLSEQLDAEKVYGFVQGCVERMVAGVHRNEGTVTQFTGDGVVALFGAPIAHEDAARRAVAAALEIQDALTEYIGGSGIDTAFRIGLNTGPVVVGRVSDDLEMDYTAVGDTVNLGARMEQIAEPGTVYLTKSTYADVADYFECEDLGPREIKGKSEQVHVYRALSERGVKTRLDAAVARGLSPFVGRDRDIDVLRGLWDDALAGRGQIVMISGEPGIGKSRLLLEFRRALGEDVIWREAHCISYGENIPYLPVIELVKNGFGITETDDDGAIIAKVDSDTALWSTDAQKTIPYLKFLLQVDSGDTTVDHMDPMERRAGILDALRALILERAKVAPRVVVIEDLHWADDQSEEAFRVCADAVAASQVLMILTFRPGYMHPSGDLPNAHRIVLNNLDADARVELANATLFAAALPANLLEPVTRKAEGNPLFIEEVTKALAAGATDASSVPNSLQDVILARIDRLEHAAREALQLASVIGREFTVRLLDRISDLHAELEGVLVGLKTLELIYEKTFFPELAYMFKHALTHDVAYSTLLVERRKLLHGIVAAAIEELYPDRLAEHYETLAHHFVRAEHWDKALDYLDKAGDKAAAAFANDEAVKFYDSAIEICDRFGDAQQLRSAAIAQKSSFIALRQGRFDYAFQGIDRMTRVTHAAGFNVLEGTAWGFRAFVHFFNHELEAALEAAERAVEVAPDDPDVRFMGLFARASYNLFTNRFAEARTLFGEMGEVAQNVGHPWIRGLWAWEGPVFPHWDGDYEMALREYERLKADRESSGDITHVLWGRWVEAMARSHRGEYEEGLRIYLELVADAERVGDLLILMRTLNSVGWVYGELQDIERAMEWNRKGLEDALSAGFPDPEIECNAALNLGDNLLALGRLDEAEEQYRFVERVYRDPSPAERFMLWRYSQHMLHSYGELWLARGVLGKARQFADECLALAEPSVSRKNIVKGRRLRGQVLLAEGNLTDAEREVRFALDLAREVANPGQLWKTLDALGDVLSAADRQDEALAAYDQAVAVIDGVAAGLKDEALKNTFLGSQHITGIRAKSG